MDPISVIAAVSSVVGIAGFGLQLYQVLDRFIDQVRSTDESIRVILEGIRATSDAMEQVKGFLDDENENIKKGHKAMLFNAKALSNIKGTADQCLELFWRIEDTITTQLDSKTLEVQISNRLSAFNKDIESGGTSKVLKLDQPMVLRKLKHLKWPLVAPKLEQYNVQLHRLQTNLILMFQVISIRAMSRKE
jgi:hypothetical protein